MAANEQSRQTAVQLAKPARIQLDEFAEAMTAGVLRAIDAREFDPELRPWIWAGWIIGPDGGPFDRPGNSGPRQ